MSGDMETVQVFYAFTLQSSLSLSVVICRQQRHLATLMKKELNKWEEMLKHIWES